MQSNDETIERFKALRSPITFRLVDEAGRQLSPPSGAHPDASLGGAVEAILQRRCGAGLLSIRVDAARLRELL